MLVCEKCKSKNIKRYSSKETGAVMYKCEDCSYSLYMCPKCKKGIMELFTGEGIRDICSECGFTYHTCQFCGQGHIHKYIVNETNEIIHICDECDLVWINYDDKYDPRCSTSFDIFMKERNLKPLWTEITKIEEK